MLASTTGPPFPIGSMAGSSGTADTSTFLTKEHVRCFSFAFPWGERGTAGDGRQRRRRWRPDRRACPARRSRGGVVPFNHRLQEGGLRPPDATLLDNLLLPTTMTKVRASLFFWLSVFGLLSSKPFDFVDLSSVFAGNGFLLIAVAFSFSCLFGSSTNHVKER